MLEGLPDAETSPGARRVRAHLDACGEVVAFEIGFADSEHLGAPIAEVLALYIAEQGNGLVCFYNRDWATPDNRWEPLLTTSE